MSIKSRVSLLVEEHVRNRYSHDQKYALTLLKSIKLFLSNNGSDYFFSENVSPDSLSQDFFDDDFQNKISRINEKEDRRKKDGVFYTDSDVTDFIVANTFLHYLFPDDHKVYSYRKAIERIFKATDSQLTRLLKASIIDPTCGGGEFLISALNLKIRINESRGLISITELVSTLFGNDIETTSTDVTKLRLFFIAVDNSSEPIAVSSLAQSLKTNFFNVDAVVYNNHNFGIKDIVIGNPPYVEYRNFDGQSNFDYGNVYADVLHNSVDMLSNDGIMAFVIPLSYVSTIRMKDIREYLSNQTDKQIVLNFADRPDSLFSSVHQKLTILFAQRGTNLHKVFSSSYNYWYTNERTQLFDNISTSQINQIEGAYWPKIGCPMEDSIYRFFSMQKGDSVFSKEKKQGTLPLYINQRGCFWMKAFTKDMKSNSYGVYHIPQKYFSFTYCLVNSSLFFLLWIIISDGWHITNKELAFIKMPKNIGDASIWDRYMTQLENKLESTKVYVGTKQVDYEYKHKSCKDIIDEIDKQLASVYNLSGKQLNYIINFALKYRLGDGPKA